MLEANKKIGVERLKTETHVRKIKAETKNAKQQIHRDLIKVAEAQKTLCDDFNLQFHQMSRAVKAVNFIFANFNR